ncbi:hypothetical protein E2C01_094810 [Portunus trituberculatus]|uniref:Uncharacterized protein n=1 Tax=Portunus trituberculatus TaxID=210409 RepID=A0A5B7K1V4_PORTR|nr:hypothetical protein [Portunus trituberculatus]
MQLPLMHPSPKIQNQIIVTPNPASESPSGKGTRNVPRSDSSLDTSLNIFYINFCNIRDLRSNFQSVEHHHSSTKPHLHFLTETTVRGY